MTNGMTHSDPGIAPPAALFLILPAIAEYRPIQETAKLCFRLYILVFHQSFVIKNSFGNYSLTDYYYAMDVPATPECSVWGAYSNQLRIQNILTSGDSQGMNAAIRSIVRMSLCSGHIPYSHL